MAVAFVFPGQGSQTVGMGKVLAANFAPARQVFDEVDAALGAKLSAIAFEGPAEALTLTENAQPALMAVSLATMRVLEQEAVAQQRAVDAAKQSTSLSLLRYRRGLAAYLEVLTNQTIELTDERAAAALAARRIVASAQLQMALGGGWSAAQLPRN